MKTGRDLSKAEQLGISDQGERSALVITGAKKKMKLKKAAALGLSCILIVTLLAGCSGSSKKEETKKSANGKTELEFFSNKQENIDTLQKLVDKFNKQSENVEIKLNSPADPDTVLKTRMAKGDMPDILTNSGAHVFTELTSSGFLEDLTGEDFYDGIEESYVKMMQGVTSEDADGTFGVPYAANGSGVIYNKDIFEQAGVSVPTTWDEFMQVCETFKSQGIQPFELTMKASWTAAAPWNALVAGNQPENFIKDRKAGKTAFSGTHEIVLQKLSKIADYAQKDYMGTSYEDGNKNFAEGSAAMMLNGNWALPEILKSNESLNVDMFPFPSTDDPEKTKVVSGLDVIMMMSNECADKDGAKEFIRFMLEPENAQQYIDEQSAFSCVKGVNQQDSTVASLAEGLAEGKVAEAFDSFYPDGFDLAAIMSEYFLNKTNGVDETKNIEDTLKKCDEQFDVVMN